MVIYRFIYSEFIFLSFLPIKGHANMHISLMVEEILLNHYGHVILRIFFWSIKLG